MPTISEALRIEKQIACILTEIKQSVVQDIRASEPQGVNRITDNTCTVSFTSLARDAKRRSVILSPEYYIPASQAKYVEKALSGVHTATDLAKRLASLIKDNKVTINGDACLLNETTISILKKYLTNIEE